MFKINNQKASSLLPVTFKELGMTENDLEESIRNRIDLICDEKESMLVVGRLVASDFDDQTLSAVAWLNKNGVVIRIKKGSTVVDIGCGTGALVSALSDAGMDPIGVDRSEKMLAVAKKYNPSDRGTPNRPLSRLIDSRCVIK